MNDRKPHDVFNCVQLKDWEEARSLALTLEGWAFRGHTDATWRMVPTLERLLSKLQGPPTFVPSNVEAALVRSFHRNAHAHLARVPAEERKLEWLALMQHHGAPTRLLDFSRSFYVAAFFAFADAEVLPERLVAVYAVNPYIVNAILIAVAPDVVKKGLESSEYGETWVDSIDPGSMVQPAAACVEPKLLSARLAAQQGLFLCSLNLNKSLETNLFEMFGVTAEDIAAHERAGHFHVSESSLQKLTRTPIVKMLIPSTERHKVLADLRRMNISYTTLLPGLDGYARDLNLNYHYAEEVARQQRVTMDAEPKPGAR